MLETDPRDQYWSVRVVPAEGFTGYVGEVYTELVLSFEVTDSALDPIEGQWLHANVYRTMIVYATTGEAREAAERLRRFFNLAHLRV